MFETSSLNICKTLFCCILYRRNLGLMWFFKENVTNTINFYHLFDLVIIFFACNIPFKLLVACQLSHFGRFETITRRPNLCESVTCWGKLCDNVPYHCCSTRNNNEALIWTTSHFIVTFLKQKQILKLLWLFQDNLFWLVNYTINYHLLASVCMSWCETLWLWETSYGVNILALCKS